MSIEDKYDGVRERIDLGKERGYVLYDEVNDLPLVSSSSKDLHDMFHLFRTAGIEVVEAEVRFQQALGGGQAGRERK